MRSGKIGWSGVGRSVGPSTKSAHRCYFSSSADISFYFSPAAWFSLCIVYIDVHPPFASKNDAIFFLAFTVHAFQAPFALLLEINSY